jgi:hypothetical protein
MMRSTGLRGVFMEKGDDTDARARVDFRDEKNAPR